MCRTNEDIVCDTREERFKLSHNDRNTVGGSANENLYEDINDVVFPTVSHDFSHQVCYHKLLTLELTCSQRITPLTLQYMHSKSEVLRMYNAIISD